MQPGHRPRHADRLVAHVVDPALEHVAVAISRLAQKAFLPHVLSGAGAGCRIELEQRILTAGVVDEHHTASADAAHLRVEHTLHECAGDRRVDRVAAATHHVERDLGRLRLRRDDYGHRKTLVVVLVLMVLVLMVLVAGMLAVAWRR